MSGLYAVKPWFVRSLGGIEERLVGRRVTADALSFAAVAISGSAAIALVAGFLVHPWWWFSVAPLAFVRLALNALDGSVARRTGTARPFGKVLNEISDRSSDILLVAPLALFVPPVLVITALVVISLTSACGLLGDVVGGDRLTQGPMGKADRCAVIAVAALVAAATNMGVGSFALALLVMIFGGLVTIIRRIQRLAEVGRDVR